MLPRACNISQPAGIAFVWAGGFLNSPIPHTPPVWHCRSVCLFGMNNSCLGARLTFPSLQHPLSLSRIKQFLRHTVRDCIILVGQTYSTRTEHWMHNFCISMVRCKLQSGTKNHLHQGHILPTEHYCDVIVGAIASQITSLMTVCSTDYSSIDQRKHQNSTLLAFVRGIHRSPPTKGQ